MEVFGVIASAVSIVVGVLAIWLSITFYKLSTDSSSKISEAANDISASVIRLEKLFDRLYSDMFGMMRDTVSDMRRHMWPEEQATDPSTEVGLEERTQEKLEEIRNEVGTQLEKVVSTLGASDARVQTVQADLARILDDAVVRGTSAALEIRTESLRKAIMRQLSRLAAGKKPVRAGGIVDALQGEFDGPRIISELEAMQRDEIIHWHDQLLGPTSIIHRGPATTRPLFSLAKRPHSEDDEAPPGE